MFSSSRSVSLPPHEDVERLQGFVSYDDAVIRMSK
jgi:hypothetical protein